MDSNEEPKTLCSGDNRYVFLDRSHNFVTAFYPKSGTFFGNSNRWKCMGVDALEKAKVGRSNSAVLEMMGGESSEPSDISDEDSDVKSDAGTSSRRVWDAVDELSDDEGCVDDILYEEGVKKKLEFLAGMVGVDCSKPGVVLTEVVRVLRGFERVRRWYCPEEN